MSVGANVLEKLIHGMTSGELSVNRQEPEMPHFLHRAVKWEIAAEVTK